MELPLGRHPRDKKKCPVKNFPYYQGRNGVCFLIASPIFVSNFWSLIPKVWHNLVPDPTKTVQPDPRSLKKCWSRFHGLWSLISGLWSQIPPFWSLILPLWSLIPWLVIPDPEAVIRYPTLLIPDPMVCDPWSRGCDPVSHPSDPWSHGLWSLIPRLWSRIPPLWSLIPHTSLRPCYYRKLRLNRWK